MRSCGSPSSLSRTTYLILDLDDGDVRRHVLGLRPVVAAPRFRIQVLDDRDVLFELVNREPELAGQFRHLVVLQQPQVLGDDLLGRRALEAEVADLQPEALLQVAGGYANRIEAVDERQRLFDRRDRPRAHRGDLVHRGHQVAVVVEIADDRRADLVQRVIAGLDPQLPEQVVGERRRGRERVLDRGQLLDLLLRPRAVALVEVVAEEILVVLVVPGVALRFLRRLLRLLRGGRRLARLEILGGHLLEHRVLDHLLGEQLAELQRGHRQQLDRLLQRWRQNQLLGEPGLQFLLNRHDLVARFRRTVIHISPT